MSTDAAGEIQQLDLSQIRLDGGTQPRVEICQTTVDEYAEAMATGAMFPPVDVVFDGATYWLADGFHRYHAIKKNKGASLQAHVTNGTALDATWLASAANQTHGIRRTNLDKLRALGMALRARADLSNAAIAEHIGVSDEFVRKHRRRETADESQPLRPKRIGRDGKKQSAYHPPGKSKPKLSPPEEPSLPPPDNGIMADKLGQPIANPKIREAFGMGEVLIEVCHELQRTIGVVQRACETSIGVYLHSESICADLARIIHALQAVEPYALADDEAREVDKRAATAGWVPEYIYKELKS